MPDQRLLEATLPRLPHAARLARSAVGLTCTAWGLADDVRDRVVLAVSELVGNAVSHTGGRSVLLRLTMTPRRVRIEVGDAAPGPLEVREAEDEAEGGRGLWIVSELAVRWGVTQAEPGKRVWVEFALPP